MKKMGAIGKSTGFFVCLSAFLLALGTYLQTVEIPVRITSDPSAAEQTDLMHVFWPLSFALWISAFLFLVYAIFVGHRKPSATARSQKPFSRNRVIAAFALGALTSVSTFLPWVLVRSMNSGYSVVLSGVSLIRSNYWAGDVMYLVFVSSVIAILYIPLFTLIEKQRPAVARALLFLLSGICIVGPIVSVLSTDAWFYSISFLGGLLAKFESPGIGLLVAVVSAAGLIALGMIDSIMVTRRRRNPVASKS